MKTIRKSKVVCVTSAKGGVGKTIFSISLAGIYESLKKKVLLIDLDITNGGIALDLSISYKKNICDMFMDIERNTYNEFNDYTVKYDDYIDVLPSSNDPRNFNKINPSLINIILERASYLYDIIIIDTNYILNELNVLTLDFSDVSLIMTTNCPMDLKNTKSIVTLFKNLNMNKYKVILNDSVNPLRAYFSIYDIKNILKTNIDYHISSDFYCLDIEKYIMAGKILTLDAKIIKNCQSDYMALLNLAADILGGGEDE